MSTSNLPMIRQNRPVWNKGRIVGQKRPLLPKHVWAIRVRLELADNVRDLALFNMAVDSKRRGCDLVKLKVVDVFAADQVKDKPENIIDKIIEGKLNKFFKDNCLIDQKFVKDDTKTVAQALAEAAKAAGGEAKIKKFIRFEIG